MAAEGANIVVNYSRSEREAHETVTEISQSGGQAIAIKCDVSQSDQVRSMFARATKQFGRVDILVNNAGVVLSRQSTAEMLEEVWDAMMGVNLKGVFLCSQAAINQMPNKIGRIINITSISAFSGKGGPAKAAVAALTRDMAYELGSTWHHRQWHRTGNHRHTDPP